MQIQDVYFAKHCVWAIADMVAREVESQGVEKFSFVRFMEVVQEQLDRVKEGQKAQQETMAASKIHDNEKEKKGKK